MTQRTWMILAASLALLIQDAAGTRIVVTPAWEGRADSTFTAARDGTGVSLPFPTGEQKQDRAREPIVGLPCEGCEAVFQGLPENLEPTTRIAPETAQGEPMVIQGTVYDTDHQPAPGIIVYAYHTNARGVYPPDEGFSGQAAYRHGRFRGWAKTGQYGEYRFRTIRPASYPNQTTAAHVHMHVLEPGRCTYYIDSIHFQDDPLISPEEESGERPRGGEGLAKPERDEDGIWRVTRDIYLGENVPGYARCVPQTRGTRDMAGG